MQLIILLFVLLISTASSAWAETFYVRQNLAGADDGSSCANAKSMSWATTSGNWDTPPTQTVNKISGGDNVILCDDEPITSSFHVRASGFSGNRITIQFESSATKLSQPACGDANGCLSLLSRDFITIDCNDGIIESTSNGEGLATEIDSRGIVGSNADDVTIKRCRIKDQYVRLANSLSGKRRGHGINWNNGSRVVFEDITCDHMEQCITYAYGLNNSDITYRRIAATNIADGIFLGQSSLTAGNTLSGTVLVEDSAITISNTWSCCGLIHVDGMQFAAQDNGVATTTFAAELIIRRNTIGGDWSQDNTAAIFCESDGNGSYTGNRQIINNFFYTTNSKPSNGFIACAGGTLQTTLLANNTIVGLNQGGGSGNGDGIGIQTGANLGPNLTVKSNIFFGLSRNIQVVGTNSATFNNNLYDNHNTADAFYVGSGMTVAAWQATGQDANSTFGQDPLLSGSGAEGYVITASSPAYNTGVDLSASFTTDRLGTTRPQFGLWDIGAFEVAAALVVDAAQSTLTALPTPVTANGTATTTITVTLKTASNEPVSGKTVSVAATGSALVTPATVVTDTSGVAVFTATDTVAQSVVFTATDVTDSIVVTQTGTVVFSASLPTVGTPTYIGSPGGSMILKK